MSPSIKEEIQLPTESFTDTELLLYWTKYAQKLGDKGYKIMESLLLINDPVVNGKCLLTKQLKTNLHSLHKINTTD
ncbi:MAG: hypothetical protein NTX74_08555 [Flavobacterium sp.]|nr:hypothetical protein [Flavobacterium sp.]